MVFVEITQWHSSNAKLLIFTVLQSVEGPLIFKVITAYVRGRPGSPGALKLPSLPRHSMPKSAFLCFLLLVQIVSGLRDVLSTESGRRVRDLEIVQKLLHMHSVYSGSGSQGLHQIWFMQ